MKRKNKILTVLLLMAAGFCIWRYTRPLAQLTTAKMEQRIPVYSVETEEKVLSITFDSAWGTEDLESILGTLKEHRVKATFFVTGGFVATNPEAVKKIAEQGHDLGNHGDNHMQMSQLSLEECVQEIQGAHTKVKNLTGQEMWLFRPPYGDYNDTVLEAAETCGYMTTQWLIDSLDWKDYGAADIVSRVCGHKDLQNGAIILLHTGTKYTAQALDEMLTRLEEQGYRFAALSEIILRENYTIEHTGRQKLREDA